MELKWRSVSEFDDRGNGALCKALVIDDDGNMMIGRLYKDEDGYNCDSIDNFLTSVQYFIPILDLLKTIPND